MKTKWEPWLKLQDDTSCQVMHLPLRKEMAEKFNETAAIEYY